MTPSRAKGLYAALAPIYDDWQSCDGMVPFAEVARAKLDPIVSAQAARADRSREPFAFVDLACGTGTLLAGLRAQHPDWRLAGADGTAAMLGIAAHKPGAQTITWARAALDAPLPFARRFDVVGCFYDAFNHLTDAAALGRAIASAAAVLRPGGLLVFDVTNEEGFARWWRGRPQFSGDNWQLAIEMDFDSARQVGLADVQITRDGELSGRFTLVERYFPRAAIQQALAAAQLTTVSEQPWAPFAEDMAGKTWWIAQLQP